MNKLFLRRLLILLLALMLAVTTISGCKSKKKDKDDNDKRQEEIIENEDEDEDEEDPVDNVQYTEEELKSIREGFDAYTEALAKEYVESSPLNATFVYSDLESMGLEHLLYELDDLSDESIAKEVTRAKEVLEELKAFPYDALTTEQQYTYDMLIYQYEGSVEGEPYLYYYSAFQPSMGAHINLALSLMQIELESELEIQAYLERLKAVPKLFDQYIAYEHKRADIGLTLPAYTYDLMIEQIDNILKEPTEFMMYLSFSDKVDAFNGIDEAKKAEYKATCLEIIKNDIYPAYNRIQEAMKEIKQVTTNTKGVSEWKDGKAYYDYLVKVGTSYDMDTEELRAWLQQVMTEGYKDYMVIMNKRPDLAELEDFDSMFIEITSEEEMLALEQKFVSEQFHDYGVKRASSHVIPPYLEEHLPPAFYFSISLDGEDYGNMYMQADDYENIDLSATETDVHENMPGHHFYFSVLYGSDLPMIRKVMDFDAYVEGWAQYVQGKTYEYAVKDPDMYELIRANMKMMYAYQILLDIQINYDGMTKEDAIANFVSLGATEEDAENAYNRMIANPGELIDYYYGCFMIEGYLEQCKKGLKDAFDLKDFHDLILTHGGLPFSVMDRVVETYIKNGGK